MKKSGRKEATVPERVLKAIIELNDLTDDNGKRILRDPVDVSAVRAMDDENEQAEVFMSMIDKIDVAYDGYISASIAELYQQLSGIGGEPASVVESGAKKPGPKQKALPQPVLEDPSMVSDRVDVEDAATKKGRGKKVVIMKTVSKKSQPVKQEIPKRKEAPTKVVSTKPRAKVVVKEAAPRKKGRPYNGTLDEFGYGSNSKASQGLALFKKGVYTMREVEEKVGARFHYYKILDDVQSKGWRVTSSAGVIKITKPRKK